MAVLIHGDSIAADEGDGRIVDARRPELRG
jgi:hypothetical protein